MRVPLKWLRSHCDPDLDAAEIADRLDLTGTEVERVAHVGVSALDHFVVGKVVSAEQHHAADRLAVCQVEDGSGSQRTIVCGAANVAAGQTVAVALPGSVMPDGTQLGEAELRGVRSSGMILAEDEVALGLDHAGIIELDSALAAGTPLADVLPIADDVLELEITPNRPDCLSVFGVAREVQAATGSPLLDDPTAEDAEAKGPKLAGELASVEIADPDLCLRFTARVFENVAIGPSPHWLKQRLVAAGQRPICNVVDVTNYAMLETGQPLHAFDLEDVRGRRIVVRRAEDGEKLTTLDGVERELDSEMTLVCDADGPSGIAGVMGGQVSEVSDKTTRVLMEAATWVGPNILRTSKTLALRSEASTRFEKQLHPDCAIAAQRLAARLMVDVCGATMAPGTIDAYPSPAEPRVVALRPARVERLLGKRVETVEVIRILETLGFGVSEDEALTVTIPYWRDADVRREADLIEEVARIHGLDRLPTTLPSRKRAVGRLTPAQRLRRRLEDALRDRGLHEIVGWSFTAPQALARLRLADQPTLTLSNPLSEDQSLMRPLLLPALLDAAAHNASHGNGDVGLFESAHAYELAGDLTAPDGSPEGATPAAERHRLAGLLTEAQPGSWRRPAEPADFYAAKGLVELIGEIAGARLRFASQHRPFLHPGRAAGVDASGREVGWVGELHPSVAAEWDLDSAAAFELDLDALVTLDRPVASYRALIDYPAVRRDLAVVVDNGVTAAEVLAAVAKGGGELLVSTRLFDVYTGEQVGEGNRSLSIALEFRAADRTLTDEDVLGRRELIEAALGEIGGRLRG